MIKDSEFNIPQDLYTLLPFNSLDCVAIHFETILIQFLCISGFRPLSGILFILHWWGFFIGIQPGQNIWKRGMLILSNLEFPAPPYIAPITAFSQLSEYWLHYAHEIVWWPCGKVICHSQKYAREHWVMQREALLLYTIILYSPIQR